MRFFEIYGALILICTFVCCMVVAAGESDGVFKIWLGTMLVSPVVAVFLDWSVV